MRKFGVIFGLIVLVVALVFTINLGIKNLNLHKELTLAQKSVISAKYQIATKDVRIAQLHKKVILLSKKLKTAANHRILAYKLKSGDNLYDLFGPRWKKVVMNDIRNAENLPAGKIIYFKGYIHRVKAGENFAKLFGNKWQQIAWLNGFCAQQAEILPVGQCLKVPNI